MKWLKKESFVMWVSWGELLGMTIGAMIGIIGIFVVFLGLCAGLTGGDVRLFLGGGMILFIAVLVIAITQSLAHPA